ncbi:MAG: hypothetical protein HY236_00450 [Acidobacteria bacterium]|nr:hypothetical protein [Acidobacteriota bacterium]
MLDAILDWAVVFLPTVLSAVGVLVSLKAPQSKHHRALRASLVLFGLAVSGVTFWQQSRVRSTHAQEVGGLNQKLSAVLRKTGDLEGEAKQLRAEQQNARQEQQVESARRQQAERDLAMMVQNSSKSTRAGVAEDIRKSPIKVEVSGQPVQDTSERRRIREDLAEYMRRGVALRDRCRTDNPKSKLEEEAQKWFMDVQEYLKRTLDSSFLNQFTMSTPSAFSPGGVPQERVGLWLGINERVQTLSKFIDRLN